MDDSISRQAAINSHIKMIAQGLDWIPAFHIEQLPSAERHGKWIIYTVSPWDGEDVKCSVCGEKGCAPYWNYCPHCGAKMDEVGDNG